MQHLQELHELNHQVAGRYPRTITLMDGTELTVTPMVPSDWRSLEALLEDTPEQERRFFRREATDPARVERWCSQLDYWHILPLLAWSHERVAADGVLEREPGLWTSHVGKVRMLVHPDFRGKGLGRAMMDELAHVGRELKLHKLTYACAAEQASLLAFLKSAGFVEAARLAEFIRDRDGQLHDMLLMLRELA